MSTLSRSIADFNEEHGIAGITFGGRSFTNEELRDTAGVDFNAVLGKPRARADEVWLSVMIEAGAVFRRPRGQMTYKPVGLFWNEPKPYLRILTAKCETERGMRDISRAELVRMERIS